MKHPILLRLLLAAFAAAGLASCALTSHCPSKPNAKACKEAALERFTEQKLTFNGITHTVLTPKKGSPFSHPSGPPVLVLHEIPSLSSYTLDLAERIAKEGYHVYVPVLWGKPMDNPNSVGVYVGSLWHAAFHPEFQATKEGLPRRPIVGWLASLCREHISAQHHGKPIAAIGMCISGSMPLMLSAAQPEIKIVPILSQPAIPFFPITAKSRNGFGMDKQEIDAIKKRSDYKQWHCLGFRFEGDKVSPPERLAAIAEAFPGHVKAETLKIVDYHGHDHQPVHSHSVLTGCYLPPTAENPMPATHRAFLHLLDFLR